MRTQKEINYYLQNTTIKNARNLLDIESCINNNNLYLPNNVIIHKNGISFAEFYKWFENICFNEGDIIVSSLGHIHLLGDSTTSYLHLDTIHNALGILNITLTLGIKAIRHATEEEKQKLFDAIKANGYKWNAKAKILEKLNVPKFKVDDKFDITTLKPFESRVLMRSSNAREWVGTIYSHYNNNKFYGCGMCCDQCIPYEGNEYLLGTSDNCNDFYKTW